MAVSAAANSSGFPALTVKRMAGSGYFPVLMLGMLLSGAVTAHFAHLRASPARLLHHRLRHALHCLPVRSPKP
eukprot:2621907-Rhodomonas_salina.2